MNIHALLTAAVVMLTVGPACLGQSWSQFGGPNGNFQVASTLALPRANPTKHWQQTLGPGMSGVVERDGAVFTSYLVPFNEDDIQKNEAERAHREAIIALDANDGSVRWKHTYEAGFIESQQAFGGRSRAPQATPAICGDRILAIGFTGIIHCLDRQTGDVVWTKNAIEDFGAVPVQFGFSASPVPFEDKVILLLGGKDGGGLVCLRLDDGSKIWNAPCNEASYATPIRWDRPDGTHLVFATRNRVVGVDAEQGRLVWEYGFPSKGMTNVPTPMPVDDTGIVISGQGIQGTSRLDIVQDGGGFDVREAWTSKTQFFYCNWVLRGAQLWGCDTKLLLAMDVKTGETLGRFRGYSDSNIVMFANEALLFDGKGNLSTARVSEAGFRVVAKYAVLNERCWTPPTPVGSSLFCRGGDQLLCVKFSGGDPRAAVVSMKVRKAALAFGSGKRTIEERDVLEQIVSEFEKAGASGAWKLYTQIREKDPDLISFRQRRELVKMAEAEKLHDFANRVEQHMVEDFPEEHAEANRSVSNETTRGKNGLLYVEFAVRNTGANTIQAEVKGPEKNPFGYGLPIRPSQRRIEKWPVGTKLYRTELGIKKEVLLTVEETFAGRTIDIPQMEK